MRGSSASSAFAVLAGVAYFSEQSCLAFTPSAFTRSNFGIYSGPTLGERDVAVFSSEEPAVQAETSEPEVESSSTTLPTKEDVKIYIGNLPFEVTRESIQSLFEPYGEVSYVSIPVDRLSGKGRGFAFVSMPDADAADKAVAALDETQVDGRTAYVNIAGAEKRQRKKAAPELDPTKAKLYVGNLSFDTTEEQLTEHFSQFGEVHECFLPTFPEGNPRGFAFVTLDVEVSEKAIEATDGMEMDGRFISASRSYTKKEKERAKPAARRAKTQKIYVGNLSFETDEETLKPIFEEFGNVMDFYMPADGQQPGQNRGFAFVTMGVEDAQRAVEDLDGLEIDSRMIRVNVARQRGERQERNGGYDDNNEDW